MTNPTSSSVPQPTLDELRGLIRALRDAGYEEGYSAGNVVSLVEAADVAQTALESRLAALLEDSARWQAVRGELQIRSCLRGFYLTTEPVEFMAPVTVESIVDHLRSAIDAARGQTHA